MAGCGAVKATERLWLLNTYLFQASAKVLSASPTDGDLVAVALDKSIFHPKGGGQPADTGSIIGKGNTLKVTDVKLVGNVVEHYGTFNVQGQAFEEGEEVTLKIDEENRRINARNHSAGHLLDSVLEGISMNYKGAALVPGKGNHASGSCFVEYIGVVPAELRDSLREKLEAEMNSKVEEGGAVNVEVVPYSDLPSKLPIVPDYLTKGADARIVTMGDLPCPCGGTHVQDIREIGKVKITKIKKVKNGTRVSYTLDNSHE